MASARSGHWRCLAWPPCIWPSPSTPPSSTGKVGAEPGRDASREGNRGAPRRVITATEARSGKSHRDENFPVASRLVRARHRGPILAFYRFVRAADDVADHPSLTPDEKLALLDGL